MVRPYAQVVGVVLLLLGVVGFLLVTQSPLLGLLNIDVVENIVHLLTGAAMAYVGFAMRDNGTARTVVGAIGVVYLIVGILGFVTPTLFGLLQNNYTVVDNIIHLALGALGAYIGFMSPGRDTVTTAGAR